MSNPLILDTDGGTDDAQALVLLLAHGVRPVAITTVFGNVSLDYATRNMRAILALCDAREIPVMAGADRPMVQPIIDATHVHGEDGLAGAPIPDDLPPTDPRHAVDYLVEVLGVAAASGDKIDLLMIGPLTNLALALRRAPGIEAGIGMLTIMGGTVYGRGNTTPAAEFNIYADPEAADIVLRAAIATRIVPWEACVTHAIPGEEVDAALAGHDQDALGAFNKAIADQTRAMSRRFNGADIFRFVDPFAAAVVIEPGLVETFIEASSAVALAPGLTRGMTLVDPSGRLETPPVTFIETGDLARLAELYAASLRWRP